MDKIVEFIKKVGRRIKEIRIQSGLSQLDLSSLTNIEDSALRRVEAGKTNPTLKTIYKIANALKSTVSDLLKVKEDKK